MSGLTDPDLSRRERQIMLALYQESWLSVKDIMDRIPEPPSLNAVQAMLTILQDKGFVDRKKQGRKYLYTPRTRKSSAAQAALNQVLDTFFDGSIEKAMAMKLTGKRQHLSDEELARLSEMIEDARAKRTGED